MATYYFPVGARLRATATVQNGSPVALDVTLELAVLGITKSVTKSLPANSAADFAFDFGTPGEGTSTPSGALRYAGIEVAIVGADAVAIFTPDVTLTGMTFF